MERDVDEEREKGQVDGPEQNGRRKASQTLTSTRKKFARRYIELAEKVIRIEPNALAALRLHVLLLPLPIEKVRPEDMMDIPKLTLKERQRINLLLADKDNFLIERRP